MLGVDFWRNSKLLRCCVAWCMFKRQYHLGNGITHMPEKIQCDKQNKIYTKPGHRRVLSLYNREYIQNNTSVKLLYYKQSKYPGPVFTRLWDAVSSISAKLNVMDIVLQFDRSIGGGFAAASSAAPVEWWTYMYNSISSVSEISSDFNTYDWMDRSPSSISRAAIHTQIRIFGIIKQISQFISLLLNISRSFNVVGLLL